MKALPVNSKIYHIVFKNKLVADKDSETVQCNFMKRFKVPPSACKRIFSGRRIRIKKGINQEAALHFQDLLFQMGMLCDIELDTSIAPKNKSIPNKTEFKNESTENKHMDTSDNDEDEDDEDDYEDIEANFDLAELLIQANSSLTQDKTEGETVVEIIKCHEQNILDIQYLKKKQKYFETDKNFCLAEHDKKQNSYFYFNDFFQGGLYISGKKEIDTESMCVDKNIYRKGKRIFRKQLPDKGYVELTDDLYTYYIRKKTRNEIPHENISKTPSPSVVKYFFKSIACHLAVILLIGLFVSFEKSDPVEPRRFAKIAGNKIHDLQKIRKKRNQPQPPIKQEIVKLSPEKAVPPAKKIDKSVSEKIKKAPKRVASTQKTSRKKMVSKKSSTKSSQRTAKKQFAASRSNGKGAGGGPVGNVSTPNVNQKGILGLLKDTGLSLLPNDALAAVTQLDTVNVPGTFQKDTLKINGIKGHLGDTKIQIPGSSGGGRVNTKGAHQVLRTGGGDGSGNGGSGGRRVGELAKGNTGNNAVKAMIRANFNQSVRSIQGGGISRAAVKKVIDQHIDDITYCYEVALISDPSIVGKAVYEWRILMNGTVGDVHILSASIQNQQILGCIKKSIKTWDFPKPHQRQVLVSYPFVFDIVGF
ncbi:signal peptide protein [Candidatus Magnetomorum sp. HK-1]|nr:signal peptide protein [Candidatus Magnetomorum sp. HK-1]